MTDLDRGVAVFAAPAYHTGLGHVVSVSPDDCSRCERDRRNEAARIPLACYFCHRSRPIELGTYTRINFAGIGVKDVCDDCRERGDETPDEWVQEHDGYDLVIDGSD